MRLLLKRFEFFDFKVIRDEKTGSDAILIYAKDKPIDDVEGKTYAIVTISGTLEPKDIWQDVKISQVQFEETEARAHSLGSAKCKKACTRVLKELCRTQLTAVFTSVSKLSSRK